MFSDLELIYTLVFIGVVFYIYYIFIRQRKYIKSYEFPVELVELLKEQFDVPDVELILRGLREYFLVLEKANNAKFFVPSKAILIAWEEFIKLDEYKKFSNRAFSVLIVPPKRKSKVKKNVFKNSFRTVLSIAAKSEDIHLKKANELPFIFKLDSLITIDKPSVYTFKKSYKKSKGSRSKRKNSTSSWSVSYSSENYSEYDFDVESMNYDTNEERDMNDYDDNVTDTESSTVSSSSDSNSSSSGGGFWGSDSSGDSGSSGSSSSSSSSDSGGGSSD